MCLFVIVRNVHYLVLTRQNFTEIHITCIGLAIIIDVRHILIHNNINMTCPPCASFSWHCLKTGAFSKRKWQSADLVCTGSRDIRVGKSNNMRVPDYNYYRLTTASINPRLLFSHAAYASWGFSPFPFLSLIIPI